MAIYKVLNTSTWYAAKSIANYLHTTQTLIQHKYNKHKCYPKSINFNKKKMSNKTNPENLMFAEKPNNLAETDCLACRLISGTGVMAIGVYLYAQSQKHSKVQKVTLRVLAAGAVGLGVARLFNLKILKSKS